MCKDSKGDLWIGTFGSLIKFDTELEEYTVLREIDGSILNIVPGVINYDEDHIMLSYSEGLALIDIDTYHLRILKDDKGNNPNHLLYGRFFKSKNGCVYILNRNGKKGGIYKYCEASNLVNDYFTGRIMSNIIATDNYLHYHGDAGVIESRNLNTDALINHRFEIEDGAYIKSIALKSGDTILVSDIYHMYEYHPESGLKKIEELSQSDVYRHESVFVDSDGDIWNGRQRDGMFVWDSMSGEVAHYDHESDPPLVYQDYIVDFIEDEDRDIWIATEQGWTIFDKSDKTTRNYLTKEIDGIGDTGARTINALAQTEMDQVWIGTANHGVFLWSKSKESVLTHIDDKRGLPSNKIYDIEVDSENNIWLATSMGLSWVNSDTHEVKNFGREFGINNSTYCLTFNKGTLYVGHRTGYYYFDIDTLLQYDRPVPQPVILGFELYDRNQDSLLYNEDGISLPHDQNFFAFSYGSINYFDPHLEQYQYRLEGIDQSWIDDRGDNKKGYTNIDHGSYTFHVRAKTSSSDWTDPASVKIRIRPAWYQTLWFKLLLGVIIGLLIWLWVRGYVKRQRRELEIDKRLAQLETMILKSQMNPHFIFNSLNSIRYLFMKDEKEQGLKYITKFARLLRTTLQLGDHALVNLEEEIELTELFIQLEQLRFDDSFTYTSNFDCDSRWREIKIPPFVIQPIVENAFWHGLLPSDKKDKNLDISVHKKSKGYEIIIEDNGVGLSAKSDHTTNEELNKGKSYGLNIIQERFDLMNKSQQFKYSIKVADSSKYDKGTAITILIQGT